MSSEALINAELTIGSLMVLGFSPFAYMDNFSGLSGLSQLTVYSFDKQNEKFLMVVLHFLLSRLDQEEFPSSVEFCFPYFDMKTKNEYKRAVIHSFERLVEQNLLTSGICKSSLLSLAKGPEIWSLLRVLSDLCVEFELAEIKGEDMNVIALKYYESIDIQECIEEELHQIEEVIIEGIQQEKENCNYFNELDGRLRKATKTIEQARKKLHAILVNDVPLQVLTESGRLQRSEWIEKITKSKQLLSGLAHSPLLAKARELLEADREAMSRGALAVQNKNKVASMTSQKWEEMFQHASEALLTPEMQEQRLVLDAVGQLVEQIDQILVV